MAEIEAVGDDVRREMSELLVREKQMRAFLQVPRRSQEEVRKVVGREDGVATGEEGGGKKRKL